MEIPEINMISDFQAAGIQCIQNPSLISRFFPIESFPNFQLYSFWKWGALIFAIYATFTSLVQRIKLVFIYLHMRVKPSLLLHQKFDQILDFSDYDDDVSVASASSSDDEADDDQEIEVEDDKDSSFRVKGSRLWLRSEWQSGNFWQNSLACNITKESVVKFWDSLGLSLDFDEDLINYDDDHSDVVVSTWGFDSDNRDDSYSSTTEHSWNIPLTAEGSGKGDAVVVRGYDNRLRRRSPALHGEWRSTAAEEGGLTASISGDRVYVRDEVSGLMTVGDVRNMRMPLVRLTAEWDGVSSVEDELEG